MCVDEGKSVGWAEVGHGSRSLTIQVLVDQV